MKVAQLRFCLLLWCGAAEGFTDKLVDLGQNVTLDCDISVKNVYWFLMKPSQPPVYILQSFNSATTVAVYNNSAFKERFSLQLNSSLFIYNITVNQLGIYYCILNNTPLTIGTGTRIHATNESRSDHRNKTEDSQQPCDREEKKLDLEIFLLVSGVMNCVLLFVVTGVTVWCCKKPPKLQPQPPVQNIQPQQDVGAAQYEEIELPTLPPAAKQSQANGTYALLQFPKPRRGA